MSRTNLIRLPYFLYHLAILIGIWQLIACSTGSGNGSTNESRDEDPKRDLSQYSAAIKKIEPFFDSMGKSVSYDWLGNHNEPGQTFNEYVDSGPTIPTRTRRTIYVLPLGTFTSTQKKVIEITTGYLESFYSLPTVKLTPKPLTVTRSNIRIDKFTHTRQIKTGFILNEVLKPILPNDAAALIAFTADDLYPDESMNYVFGQASFDDRVGVWSLARMDDNANYGVFLRRTLKIAVHETGHMFSMRHCTKYECVMSGTNHLMETDRRPIDACPECSAKIWWFTEGAPKMRYAKLAEFCRTNGLTAEADEFLRKSKAVSSIVLRSPTPK